MAQNRRFLVMEVYYKHGGYHMVECNSDATLRQYLYDYMTRFKQQTCFGVEYIEKMSLHEMIYESMAMGDRIISDNAGHGIVSIIEVTGAMTVHGGVHESL